MLTENQEKKKRINDIKLGRQEIEFWTDSNNPNMPRSNGSNFFEAFESGSKKLLEDETFVKIFKFKMK